MISNHPAVGYRRFPLRTLALAGTALTAIAAGSPAGAVPGNGTTVVNSAADLTNPLDFDGGTLQFNVMLTTANNATFTGAGGTIDTNGFNVVMSGVFSGTGGLTKTGNGQLYLSGANTYTGGTTVSGGELAGDTTSLRGDITNNATVGFIQNSDGTYAGSMSGTGSLTKVGTGTLTLSGNNSFTGGIVLVGGALAISSGSNLGSGTLNINNPTTVRFTNTLSANNTIELNDAGTFEVTG
ncbi:MAG: Extracellular serine protease precursor, partial [Rhodospirillales bacterium]|nr:Extracellular serine protease precursor [Rhodospirillales bacterium]